MKKIIVLIMATLLGIAMVACGNGGETGQITQPPANDVQNHTFIFRNVEIPMGAHPDSVVLALGPPQHEMRQPNCAIEGEDVMRYFPGMVLSFTYPADGGAPFIASVRLMDDSLTTPEGLYIGAAADMVAQLYGQYDREVNGFYYFDQGRSTLEIAVENGVVMQITYQYLFLD